MAMVVCNYGAVFGSGYINGRYRNCDLGALWFWAWP